MPDAPDILAAGTLLAERGVFGLVWLDCDLVAVRRYGELAERVPLGANVCESVPVLIGLEDEITALRRRAGRVLELPSVAWASGADLETPKLNLGIHWDGRVQLFLMLISHAAPRNDLQHDLDVRMRAARLAEETLVEQAREIAATNRELAITNSELAQFAEIVTHDLSSPIRAMRYFADDLEHALTDPSAGDPRAHILRLRAQSRRMTSMLRSLLEYVRIGRRSEALEPVDTHELVRDIAASLPRPDGFEIEIVGEWPMALTLRAPLDLVLRNLIDNAIRHAGFKRGSPGGRLTLACTQTAAGIAIEVADDGPGIAPEMHEAIFNPFTSLSGGWGEADGEVAGSGMGLALVKRALGSVGAGIKIQSAPAERPGTTFKIEWPCWFEA